MEDQILFYVLMLCEPWMSVAAQHKMISHEICQYLGVWLWNKLEREVIRISMHV